jgi:hypothetical protein
MNDTRLCALRLVRLSVRRPASVARPRQSPVAYGTTAFSGAFAASRFTNSRAAPGTPFGS